MVHFEDKTKNFFEDFYKKEKRENDVAPRNVSRNLLEEFISQVYCSFDLQKFLSVEIKISTPNIKVLDLGCGEGKQVICLVKEKHQGNFFAVDVSLTAVEKARQEARRELAREGKYRQNYKLQFSLQDAKNLNFKDEFFDYVYIVMLLHHVDDYRQVISEAKRVLKKNGKLLIVDLKKYNFLFSLTQIFLKFFSKKTLERLFEGDLLIDGKFPERSNISSKDLRKFLTESDFLIERESYYYLFFQYLLYFYRLFPLLFRLFLPLNIFLVRLEDRLRKYFRFNCDMYVFVCRKS